MRARGVRPQRPSGAAEDGHGGHHQLRVARSQGCLKGTHQDCVPGTPCAELMASAECSQGLSAPWSWDIVESGLFPPSRTRQLGGDVGSDGGTTAWGVTAEVRGGGASSLPLTYRLFIAS